LDRSGTPYLRRSRVFVAPRRLRALELASCRPRHSSTSLRQRCCRSQSKPISGLGPRAKPKAWRCADCTSALLTQAGPAQSGHDSRTASARKEVVYNGRRHSRNSAVKGSATYWLSLRTSSEPETYLSSPLISSRFFRMAITVNRPEDDCAYRAPRSKRSPSERQIDPVIVL
jgi:hypothetical protein